MVTFRVLLFSMLAAFLLYIPFYYFAPYYRELYTHINLHTVNWWYRIAFSQHNGIQAYIAYALMFLAIGLTFFFEYIYIRFIPSRARWIALAIAAMACFFYLWTIRFNPPYADIGVDRQGIIFIITAIMSAFIFGYFFDRKPVKGLLLFLLFFICMVPPLWAVLPTDYFYLMGPALRTLNGYALNQSYFQYDHLFCPFAVLWMKLHLPLDRFHVVGDFAYLSFFIGIYFMAKNLFLNKQLAPYFIFSLVLIKIYGNILDITACPQVTPLRLDLWLLILALSYWKGPQHWIVGMALGFLLMFHHSFGMIYSISYVLFVLTILVLNISKESFKKYLPNACMMISGELINHFFIASNRASALNFMKYNITFMPIDPKSLFWYVPTIVSAAAVLFWKSRTQLPHRYLQAGTLLIFLAIGNSIYFFGRSHENNLINISVSLWLMFFMLLDLIVYRSPQELSGVVKRIFIPMAGIFIVGLIAVFYSHRAADRIEKQVTNLSLISYLFKDEKVTDLDLNTVRKVTGGSPNVVFLSTIHDLEYYYYGGYTPADICPLETQMLMRDLMDNLNNKILQGAYIIVPQREADPLIETEMLINAKYVYKISDFVYISNNQPVLQ